MSKEKKSLDDMTDEEFEKASEAGEITPQGDKPEDNTEEDKKEEVKEEKKDEADDESDDDSSEESEDSDDDDEDVKKSPHVPYKKFKKQKEKFTAKEQEWENEKSKMREELEELRELKDSKTKKSSDDFEDKRKAFIESTGLDEEVVSGLLDLAKTRSGVSPDLEKRLGEYEKGQKAAQEELLFEKDFNDNVATKLREEFDEVSVDQLKKVKTFIKKEAYKKKNAKIPLPYLYAYNSGEISKLLDVKKKKSAEGSRIGKNHGNRDIDYSKITKDDIKGMSDSEFEKYSDAMAKDKKQFTIYRNGEKVT